MSGVADLFAALMSGPHVDISAGGGVSDAQSNPTPALAQIAFESDGDITEVTVLGPSDAGDWITPKSAAPGSYEIMAHQNSGDALDIGSSALDSWLALSGSPSWSQTQTGPGSKTANLTISIRLSGATLSSGTFTLSATVV